MPTTLIVPQSPAAPPQPPHAALAQALIVVRTNPYWPAAVAEKAQAALGGRTPTAWHLLEAERQLLAQLLSATQAPAVAV